MEFENGVLHFSPFMSVTLGIIVLFLGKRINDAVGFLREFSIPEPVTGGLIVSVLIALVYVLSGVEVEFELTARDVLLVYFFTTIGINASLKDLLSGGKPLIKARVDTDGGEKINQQDISCCQIETDFDTANEIQQRNQQGRYQAAGDRLRYAEFPEKTNSVIDPLAEEQHDNAQCNREKGTKLQNTVIEFHGIERLNARSSKVYGYLFPCSPGLDSGFTGLRR